MRPKARVGWAGPVWRLSLAGADPLAPAAAPMGRFHHDGQPALYASLTPDGAGVAMARYLANDTRPRVLVPLQVLARDILDLTDRASLPTHLAALLARGDPSMIWQPEAEAGQRPLVWDISDAARLTGAEGMIYASRSRRELRHLVLFRWGEDGAQVEAAGTAAAWPATR